MTMINPPMTLKGIEKRLEKELSDTRIIGDMDFSYEDYRFLATKVKGLLKFQSSLSDLRDYKLCLATYWVFTLKYEDINKAGFQDVMKLINRLPQYQVKYFLNLSLEAYHEYGIDTFGKDDASVETVSSITAMHAGMDEDFYETLFHILDDSLKYASVDELYEKIMSNLSNRMNNIFKYIDEDIRSEMFYDCRDMFIDYKINKMSSEELLNKYHFMSRRLLDACIEWCKIHEESEHELKAGIC